MKIKLLKPLSILFISLFLNLKSFASEGCKEVYVSTDLRFTFFKYKIIDRYSDEFLVSGQLGFIVSKLFKKDKTIPTKDEVFNAANNKEKTFYYCPNSDETKDEKNSLSNFDIFKN